MPAWLTAISLGAAAFVATNIDDIFLLTALFAARHLRTRAVVLGQFVGIAVLVLASVIAAQLALVIAPRWLALLGLAPLWLGLMQLRARWRGEDEDGDAELQRGEEAAERRWHSQIVAVAAITIANGGDNLGVYIPLFAHTPSAIPIYIAVFALLTGLWCALGHALVTHRVIGAHIQRFGHALLPFVLIALGLLILIDGWW